MWDWHPGGRDAKLHRDTTDSPPPQITVTPKSIIVYLKALKVILLSILHVGKTQKPEVCGSEDRNLSQEEKPPFICPCHSSVRLKYCKRLNTKWNQTELERI